MITIEQIYELFKDKSEARLNSIMRLANKHMEELDRDDLDMFIRGGEENNLPLRIGDVSMIVTQVGVPEEKFYNPNQAGSANAARLKAEKEIVDKAVNKFGSRFNLELGYGYVGNNENEVKDQARIVIPIMNSPYSKFGQVEIIFYPANFDNMFLEIHMEDFIEAKNFTEEQKAWLRDQIREKHYDWHEVKFDIDDDKAYKFYMDLLDKIRE